MRQSAGKSVKKRLATARSAHLATGEIAVGWAARIRKPVLLKTASYARLVSFETRRYLKLQVSIAGVLGATQRGYFGSKGHRLHFLQYFHFAPACVAAASARRR